MATRNLVYTAFILATCSTAVSADVYINANDQSRRMKMGSQGRNMVNQCLDYNYESEQCKQWYYTHPQGKRFMPNGVTVGERHVCGILEASNDAPPASTRFSVSFLRHMQHAIANAAVLLSCCCCVIATRIIVVIRKSRTSGAARATTWTARPPCRPR